ncbi:DUF3108 domain-containing protein [Paucibacter sp. AS339]|uniref:DUF3108 domain-containing protein n=1 Tax=Paucibacter hankyongi TaxID=3133434 RepID=UPI0030A86C90
MAERLKRGRAGPSGWAWLVLLVPVLGLHLWLLLRLQDLQQDWAEMDSAMPARMTVAFVRALQPVADAAAAAAVKRPQAKPAPKPKSTLTPGPIVNESAASSPAEAVEVPEPEPAKLAPDAGQVPLNDGSTPPAQPVEPPAEPPAPEAPQAFEPGPEWPPSTRLSYQLTGNYRGAIYGSAQVEWLRQGSHYQMHMDVAVGPSFAPLISRRMSSDGQLTAAGIAPQRYDEDTRVLFSARRRSTLMFGPQTVTLANGRSEASVPGTQDAASQFVQLTWLFLTGRESMQAGKLLDLPLALPGRQYRWRYEVLGEEILQTPMGALTAWHLAPRSLASGGDLSSEVWLAPSLQYLPVRLRIRQDDRNYVDLLLESAPLQEAAAAAASSPASLASAPRPSRASIVAPQVSDKENP